jgi:hypothetical protein
MCKILNINVFCQNIFIWSQYKQQNIDIKLLANSGKKVVPTYRRVNGKHLQIDLKKANRLIGKATYGWVYTVLNVQL